MISAGMDVARINCAHDNIAVWERMVSNVRAASTAAGTDSRIMMDLPGPKLRTGELRPGPRVMHLRPKKDALGRVVAPRRIRFMPEDMLQHGTKSAVVPVPRACMEQATPGDEVHLQDTRGKRRHLKVVEKDAKGLILESYNVVYIATGTELQLVRQQTGETLSYRVGELPAIEQPILLRQGDFLILHARKEPGEGARTDANGEVIAAAHVACQQPEVFAFVNAGDPISLNDGKISGVVRAASPDELEVEITKAKPSGSRLRGQRGINFPGSDIQLPGLTASDREHLRFVVEHADAVSLSFVRKPDDIRELQDALEEFPDNRLGVVIKIETKRGFSKLPQLILTAMRSYPAAVMIARGDLAVECGWERLAELQEEILWFCEAARLPVMWATQVLEDVAKKGQPSRAEISDAAMSQRADCVMLNKGPYILAAIRMLDNILRRMQKHQFKKTARMKKLSVSSSSA
ncbi:MAG: pyruvate kinase, partial [Woeseiaceae bacterium]